MNFYFYDTGVSLPRDVVLLPAELALIVGSNSQPCLMEQASCHVYTVVHVDMAAAANSYSSKPNNPFTLKQDIHQQLSPISSRKVIACYVVLLSLCFSMENIAGFRESCGAMVAGHQ